MEKRNEIADKHLISVRAYDKCKALHKETDSTIYLSGCTEMFKYSSLRYSYFNCLAWTPDEIL